MGLIDRLIAKRLEARRRELETQYADFHDRLRIREEQLHEAEVSVQYLREQLRQEQADAREDFLKALSTIAEHFSLSGKVQAEQVGKLAEAAAKQADAVQSHLSLYNISTAPVSRTIRDQDEFVAETMRTLHTEFPEDASPDEQIRWVLANT
jgi:hypothetical protein